LEEAELVIGLAAGQKALHEDTGKDVFCRIHVDHVSSFCRNARHVCIEKGQEKGRRAAIRAAAMAPASNFREVLVCRIGGSSTGAGEVLARRKRTGQKSGLLIGARFRPISQLREWCLPHNRTDADDAC
jgi:hypothetical protein